MVELRTRFSSAGSIGAVRAISMIVLKSPVIVTPATAQIAQKIEGAVDGHAADGRRTLAREVSKLIGRQMTAALHQRVENDATRGRQPVAAGIERLGQVGVH